MGKYAYRVEKIDDVMYEITTLHEGADTIELHAWGELSLTWRMAIVAMRALEVGEEHPQFGKRESVSVSLLTNSLIGMDAPK